MVVSPIEPEEEVVYLFLDPSAQQGQELRVCRFNSRRRGFFFFDLRAEPSF
jgi:hypothetical protein